MRRPQLTYANVTSTLALVLAMGAGGAYAVDRIGSGEIENNSIRSVDLKNGQAVKGGDVRRNSLTGKQVNESKLAGADIVRIAGDQPGACGLDAAFVSCASVDVSVRRRSVLTATATGAFSNDEPDPDDPAAAECRLQVDGVSHGFQSPGETINTTGGIGSDGFARTDVVDPLGAGVHEVVLACRELAGAQSTIYDPTLSVIAVATR